MTPGARLDVHPTLITYHTSQSLKMELLYILIAVLIILLPLALSKLLSGRSTDTKKVLGAEPRGKPPAAPRISIPQRGGDPVREEASGLLTQGRKMDAIKLMREKTGLGLKEAKEAVESLEKLPASPPPASLVATLRRAQDTSDEVQKLVAKGQKIEAIKLIRDRAGLGLKEAKDLVDRLG